MSADLFAEFNSPPSGQTQQQQPQGNHFQATASGVQQDPFGSLQHRSPNFASPQQLSQQWSGIQSQPSGTSNWGSSMAGSGFGGLQSPAPAPVPADEDDGWGDFETGEASSHKPTMPEPISWQPPAQPSDGPKPAPSDPWASYDQQSTASTQPDPWSMFTEAEPKQSNPEPEPKPISAFKHPEPGRLVRASTMDIIAGNLVAANDSSKPSSPVKPDPQRYEPPAPRPKLKEPTNPNVMFDAEDFELEGGDEDDEDDDEFGDFETVAPSRQTTAPVSKAPAPAQVASKPSQHLPSMDLLSLDEPSIQIQEIKQTSGPKSPKPRGFGATNLAQSKQGPGHAKASSISRPAPKLKPVVAEDEEWGAWDDFESKPAPKPTKPLSPAPVENWDWEPAGPSSTTKPGVNNTESPPPINVPPPSVLLSAFPPLFSTGNALFKPVSAQTPSIKDRVLSDPKAVEFLEGYILIAITAGHVIAGRKQRWHRDKILAKSMSISAAGSKGMKLAGVDKTQSKREDREAADVAISWGEYVGRLRSAVAAANSSAKASLKVPELSENMQVQTAKMAPTAAKPCIICGLKREERVSKLDFNVEDSFGEWWVDHWGHKACKNFWLQHEQTLRQR